MSGLLTASGLSFAYGKTEVLRDVGLELFPSEVVALIGPNGSGKSTLIKSLIGFLHARGEINVQLQRYGRAISQPQPLVELRAEAAATMPLTFVIAAIHARQLARRMLQNLQKQRRKTSRAATRHPLHLVFVGTLLET